MSNTTLYLIRHGESEWNRAGLIQGQHDTPLTETGIAQAEALGLCLANTLGVETPAKPRRIYSSPLTRATDTASIIASHLHYPTAKIVIEPRINDFNLGSISGMPGWDRVAEEYPELARYRLEDPLRFRPPGGESGLDFQRRLHHFLLDLETQITDHIVVSHGVVNKFLRSLRRNLTGSKIIALSESQDTIYRLDGECETEIQVSTNP